MKSLKKQHGGAIVEFAILAPFLLLLAVGISELGTAYYNLNILNKSVQTAARYFSKQAENPTIARAQNLVIYGSINAGTRLINSTVGTVAPPLVLLNSPANHVTVSAGYTHSFILGGLLNGLMQLAGGSIPSSIVLNASSVMRISS